MRVFRRHGFRRSSLDETAEEAGLTRQALYHHFSSKEALFRAAIERLYEQALAAEVAASRAAQDAGSDIADVVVAEIGARLGVLFEALQGSPHLDELYSEHLAQARDIYQSYSARFGEQVGATITRVCRARGRELGDGVTVAEVARCVEMAVHGAKSAYPSMQPADAFLNDLATMVRMLIGGALAQPRAPAATRSRRRTGDRK